MSLTRTAAIVVVVGAVAGWLSAAMTPGDRVRPALATVRPTPLEHRGAELEIEINRLHERLSPDTAPSEPSRNLFRFRAAAVRPLLPVATESSPPIVTPPLTEQLVLKLAGIAEDAGPDGPVRTAIISTNAQLFLVKEGESVTSAYRVATISAGRVDLTDTRDGSIRHLDLK